MGGVASCLLYDWCVCTSEFVHLSGGNLSSSISRSSSINSKLVFYLTSNTVQDRKGVRWRVACCNQRATQRVSVDWGCSGILQQLRCMTMLKWCSLDSESNRKSADMTVWKTATDYLVLLTRPQSLCTYSLFNVNPETRPQTYPPPPHHLHHLTSTANISAQPSEASAATAKSSRCQLAAFFHSPRLQMLSLKHSRTSWPPAPSWMSYCLCHDIIFSSFPLPSRVVLSECVSKWAIIARWQQLARRRST